MDTIRVVRLLIYEGPREGVEDLVSRSIHGIKNIAPFSKSKYHDIHIQGLTLGVYPEAPDRGTAEVSQ